jgi:transposase-like protein
MEKCNRCKKTDNKPKLKDRYGWVHHNCYVKWSDRNDQRQGSMYDYNEMANRIAQEGR